MSAWLGQADIRTTMGHAHLAPGHDEDIEKLYASRRRATIRAAQNNQLTSKDASRNLGPVMA